MKKLTFILILICSVMMAVQAFASEKGIDDGDINIYAGVGWGMYGIYGDTEIPPVNVGVDYCIKFGEKVPITFGAVFAYSRSSYGTYWGTDYEWTYSYYTVGFR